VKAVLLIAINFVREQRWPILVLLLWVLLLAFLGLMSDIEGQREYLLFVFKQVAFYVVVFSVFFGGSAIYSERRSRRILAVLAKAISRQQYLSGLVLGVTIASGIYCFALGLTGSWTLAAAGFPMSQLWFLMLTLVVASMLAGTIALMFSTFLNPFLAASATAAVLGLPAVVGESHTLAAQWGGYVIPVYALMKTVLESSYHAPGRAFWPPILLAIAETVGFWIVAARIFAFVDIAVSVE
jgi:ABC-type transport system involved in multi-copper enzyme maturation permease subunit